MRYWVSAAVLGSHVSLALSIDFMVPPVCDGLQTDIACVCL